MLRLVTATYLVYYCEQVITSHWLQVVRSVPQDCLVISECKFWGYTNAGEWCGVRLWLWCLVLYSCRSDECQRTGKKIGSLYFCVSSFCVIHVICEHWCVFGNYSIFMFGFHIRLRKNICFVIDWNAAWDWSWCNSSLVFTGVILSWVGIDMQTGVLCLLTDTT